MQTAVVTGAAGFVGCNLVECLLEYGYYVYAVVRPGSAHNSRLRESERLKLVYADMSEFGQLAEKIDDTADIFFHIAWGGNRYNFAEQWQNIEATLGALRSAKILGAKRFVATGSQAEYGPQTELITEETLPHPIDAYGSVKLATCIMSRQLALDMDIEWIWGRIFSVYGKYEPHGRMLSDLINALTDGNSFSLSAATQYWDYLYSSDCAEALVALGERGCPGEIYNIANGDCRPLREFTEIIRSVVDSSRTLCYGEAPGVVYSLMVKADKIKADTGWEPVVDFAEGVAFVLRINQEVDYGKEHRKHV